MGLFRSLNGFVRVQVTGADLAGVLNRICLAGISVGDMSVHDELNASFTVSRHDARKLEEICEKGGAVVEIEGRRGMFWKISALKHRPVLVIGLMLFLLFSLWMPSRVLFIRVEGNREIPDQIILERARECGIRFGVSRRDVRSERMKNSLLAALPQLQWAGINTYGCRAVITVRESPEEEEQSQNKSVSSIVAALDGVITECTVTKGNPLCVPGQAVTGGQVLISGYTDCGICIRATRAEGEILAQTNRQMTLVTPSECMGRVDLGSAQVFYSLLLGKKRINFYKGSGIYGGSCVKMYSKYVLTLPGGFELPVSLIRERVIPSETQNVRIPDQSQMLERFARNHLTGQMIAGQILREQVQILEEDGCFRLRGKYACRESIGVRREEKVGEHNG